MIKVLYIHQDGQITGSAISLMQMIKGFEPGTVKPVILFFDNGPAVEWFRKEGIECMVSKGRSFWTTPGPKWYQLNNIRSYKALWPDMKIRRIVRSIAPDLIHINDKAALNAGISSAGLGIPIIQHLRSTNYICRTRLNKWLSTLLIESYAACKIAISEDEAADFRLKNTSVIFNSIDFNDINKAIENKIELNNDKIKIGWLGRFSTSKGSWDFINMAGLISEKFPEAEFHMLAPIPDEKEKEVVNNKIVPKKDYLQSLITQNKLGNNLVLHGYRKDFLSVVASMNIMINCNRLGALGRQAFETVSLGVPTIVTAKYPGRSSVLNKDVCIIEKEGDITSISNAALKLISDNELRKELSAKGKHWGRTQFDNKIQSAKVIALYRNTLSK